MIIGNITLKYRPADFDALPGYFFLTYTNFIHEIARSFF
jgi:hypothetical protein